MIDGSDLLASRPKVLRWIGYGALLFSLLFLLQTATLPAQAQGKPGDFNKLSPSNQTTAVTSPVTLQWTAAAGAKYYTYCIDTVKDRVCDAAVDHNGYLRTTATTVTLKLAPGTTYEWHVAAFNETGQTFADAPLGWYTFTTSLLPANFNKVAPVDGADKQPLTTTLRWEDVPPTDGDYRVCLDTVANFSCDSAEGFVSVGAADTKSYSLQPNTTYYWQVRRHNAHGYTAANSENSWHQFRTGDSSVPTPTPTSTPALPGAFVKLSPSNDVQQVLNPVTLRWTAATGATYYTYCLWTNHEHGCESGYQGTGDANVGNVTEIKLSLVPNIQYYWQVFAHKADGSLAADNGAPHTFTTTPLPIGMVKHYPPNGTGGLLTDVTLWWSQSPFITDYRLCIDKTHDFHCEDGDAGFVPLRETISRTVSLEPNTVYSWQVRVYNEVGFTEADGANQWFWFRTGPGPLQKVTPMNGALAIALPVTLQWTPSIGAVEYGYCIDPTNDGRCDWGAQVGYRRVPGTSVSLAAPDLLPGTTYYWQARAYNEFGDATPANGVGGWHSFTTAGETNPDGHPAPLPDDSINVGPPGAPNALCCIGGYVYLDGKPVNNPNVIIRDAQGATVAAEIQSNGPYSYFRSSLTRPELTIGVGDTISITAQVQNRTYTLPVVVQAGVQQVDIVMPTAAGYTRPIATIIQSVPDGLVNQGQTLRLRGMGQDSDLTPGIQAYQWHSHRKGLLGTTAELAIDASTLVTGLHQISFIVQDNEGEWSTPVVMTVNVVPARPWTFLFYLAGDDDSNGGSLPRAFRQTIDRLQKADLPDNVNIAIMVDYKNAAGTDGDTYQTYTIGQGSQQRWSALEHMGEVAMNQPQTLRSFVQRSQQRFGDTHYYLAIADHGQAVRGTAWDKTSAADGTAYLLTGELRTALNLASTGPNDNGLQKLDILHLDSCSMNLLETAYELKDTANYLISSQYLAWSVFPYATYVAGAAANPSADELTQHIAQSYALTIAGWTRPFPTHQGYPYTISVLDLARVEAATQALSALADALSGQHQTATTERSTANSPRLTSQVFTSDGDHTNEAEEDAYVDLLDWVTQVEAAYNDAAISSKINALRNVITGTTPLILANFTSSGQMTDSYRYDKVSLERAHGLSIYYPVRRNTETYRDYQEHTLFQFTKNSTWPTFLELQAGILQPTDQLDPAPPPFPLLEVQQATPPTTTRVLLPVVIR